MASDKDAGSGRCVCCSDCAGSDNSRSDGSIGANGICDGSIGDSIGDGHVSGSISNSGGGNSRIGSSGNQ